MPLTKMQLLRCWEFNHGDLSAELVIRFLSHPAVDEICAFPAPFVFRVLKSHKKLAALLIVLKEFSTEWESVEREWKERPELSEEETDQRVVRGEFESSYWIHPGDLEYFYDLFCGDDGPDE